MAVTRQEIENLICLQQATMRLLVYMNKELSGMLRRIVEEGIEVDPHGPPRPPQSRE